MLLQRQGPRNTRGQRTPEPGAQLWSWTFLVPGVPRPLTPVGPRAQCPQPQNGVDNEPGPLE